MKIKKETFKNPKFWIFFRFVVVLKPKNLKPKKTTFASPAVYMPCSLMVINFSLVLSVLLVLLLSFVVEGNFVLK